MGQSYGVICLGCEHRFEVNEGGGFSFHLLRCDRCGRERSVGFDELGDLHDGYLKWLAGPYSVATDAHDRRVRDAFPGDPIPEAEYRAGVEATAGSCECGGSFRWDAPPRCPRCRSTQLEPDPDAGVTMYD